MDDFLCARITASYRDAGDDGAFHAELQRLAEEFGDQVCQRLFATLTGLQFDPQTARSHFDAIFAHRRSLVAALGRPVHMLTAMCDYLAIQALIGRPRIIEIAEFEYTLARAMRDTVTGLMNRQFFEGALQQQLALAERTGRSLALLFLDIDDFKAINDTRGHLAGDAVLKEAAGLVQRGVRECDVVARYGGEEFVVLMPGTDAERAAVLAERVRRSIAAHNCYGADASLRITISGGIAAYPEHARSAAELIHHADHALYRAKSTGKNSVCLFREESSGHLRR